MAEKIRQMLMEHNHRRFERKKPQRQLVELNISQQNVEEIIQNGRKFAEDLLGRYPEIPLDGDEIERDLAILKPQNFGNPSDAVHSFHDIRHMASVYAQSRILSRVMGKRYPELHIDESALRLSGPTHDMSRLLPECIESVHGINQWHGRASAKMVERRSRNREQDEFDFRSVASAMDANTYHDFHHTPERVHTPTTEILVQADRLELVRLLMDPFYGNPHNPLRKKFEKRMSDYNAKFFPEIMGEFKPLAEAIYVLSVGYINKQVAAGKAKDPHIQVEGVMYALDQLGLLQAPRDAKTPEELLVGSRNSFRQPQAA